MPRTEEDIKKDVVEQLYWDNRVDASEIRVRVREKKVRLSGTVSSNTAYQAAEYDAGNIQGVSGVNNQLRIEYPSGVTVPPDEEIKSSIKSVLVLNPSLDGNLIEIIVDDGVVTLSGSVDAFWKRRKAEELAYDVTGVIDVENEISVTPTQDYVDELIRGNIDAALARNSHVNNGNIVVEVKNGIVTLRGKVSNWYEARAANDAALYSHGVIDVKSLLKVE
jgi:osmotically-inducible protein OsmY